MQTALPTYYSAPNNGALSFDMLHSYHQDGFLILEQFISPEACDFLIDRIKHLIQTHSPPKAIPFYREEERTFTPELIQETCEKPCYFYDTTDDHLQSLSPDMAVTYLNKITHCLHDLDPDFSAFSRQTKIKNLIQSLGYQEPLLAQSMFLFKNPETSRGIKCHQDASFLHTTPITLVGLWFALEDAFIENGCLWVYRANHKEQLKTRVSLASDGVLHMDDLDTSPWPEEDCIPLQVKKGTLVVMHGLLPHYSKPNRSDQSRHAYTLHVIDGTSTFSSENWLQRPAHFPFRGF